MRLRPTGGKLVRDCPVCTRERVEQRQQWLATHTGLSAEQLRAMPWHLLLDPEWERTTPERARRMAEDILEQARRAGYR